LSDVASPAPRKRRWRLFAAGGALAGAGVLVALGPGAPALVDTLADGVRVWRLGHLRVDGVSGAWIGDLRADRVTIADGDGVWIEAREVALDWSPQDLIFGRVRLRAASADSVAVSRQPTLLDRRPPRGESPDVRIDQLRVERLTLDTPAVGIAAEFAAELALDVNDDALRAIDLELQRLDSTDDRLVARYNSEAYALYVDLASAPGGVIARALGVSDNGVRASATGEGDLAAGRSAFEAFVGDEPLLVGRTEWSPAGWSGEGQAYFDVLPALDGLQRRIGSNVAFSLAGVAQNRTFALHAETPFLALDLEGALDENNRIAGAAKFVATTERLSDIARESPFELGAARFEGELRQARGVTAIQATLDAQEIDALGRRTRLSGPIEAALSRERFSLEGDVRAPAQTVALFAGARLHTQLEYDRERQRFALTRAELTGDALAASAQGWSNRDGGEFAGEWRVRQLEAFYGGVTGEAAGRWRALGDRTEQNDRIWTIATDGEGSRIAGDSPILPQLLGSTPRLDARLRYENGGLTVSHARVESAQLRAGATGGIVRGEADLALEASARGPLSLGGADMSGAIDATGRLTGRLARPSLSLRTTLSSFAAAGVIVEHPVVDFTLAPRGGVYAGRASLNGSAHGQDLTGAADLALDTDGFALSNLDAQWGAMQAQGAARFARAGISAELDVNGAIDGLVPGVTGRLAGDVAIAPQSIMVDARIAGARAGELRVSSATLHAEGPPEAIETSFEMRGRLRDAPLTFAGIATVNAKDEAARIEGRGALADAPVFTRAPITANWRAGRIDAALDVALGDGVVRANWQERGRSLSGAAHIDDAPLAPLAAIWGERASGRIDGTLALSGSGRGLSGEADVTLSDARVSGRQRQPLDLRITGALTPTRLTSTIDATSADGLLARFEADAPVITSVAPIRIALAREQRGRASWSVRGPADALWAAARLPDQSLQGALNGEGTLNFGAGYLSGDGHIEIVDGRFEDKLTGVRLSDLDARLRLDESGVSIERFTAAGPRGGRLSASGGSINDRQGSITVDVDAMRVADRPDARAVASGQLTLVWEGLHSSLTGDLSIVEANLDIASNPQAGIPTLDVVEVHRPSADEEPLNEPPPRRNGSTTLNVNITAPGRVFTRGRGIDAEWSLDMRLGGTARRPQVFGTARAIRGTLALSGQPFEIEDATIEFPGDPLDARIDLTAVRDTADLSARIRLTGTARDPEVAFSSNPPLPEDEILPQILFGRSVEDLSAFEAAQLAASLAALSGRASLDIVDAARAAAGLDRFNVRQDEDGGFLVAGGVYLTRDVYVEVARTGLGQAQTRVEWTVRPRLVLVTSFLGNGDQRVSLRWRRESD
jgi:translocation and assembly module TamB